MTKLTAPMLIIAVLLCSCATHPAVAGKTTHESARFNGQQPNRHDTRIATRSTHHATRLQGQSVVAPHPRAAAATTQQPPVEQGGHTIDAFVITGNARMPTVQIQSAIKQYRGEHKTGTDVSNAMRRVIDLYSSSGLNGAIVTKKEHVVVLHVIESGINAGTEGGSESAGQHFTTAIKASPVITGTAQAAVMPADMQTPAVFPGAATRPATTAATHFVIRGNHLVSTAEIQQVLKPYAEGRFSRYKLFMARLSLVDLYESKGLRHVAIGLPSDLHNPVTLTIFENDIQQAAVATTARHATARLSSGWVRLGWQQMGRGNTAQAMAIWQQGVNRMPPDQLLAYIGVYMQASAAIRRLKHVGLRRSAIMLKANFHGKPAYYVMAALQVPVDKTLRRKKLAGLRRAMGRHGNIHATSAGKFQTLSKRPY